MTLSTVPAGARIILKKEDIEVIFSTLKNAGFTLIGPTISEDAIRYEEIAVMADLPQGWTDEQTPGSYRLKKRNDEAYFGYVVGPDSWKRFLYPPQHPLFTTRKTIDGLSIEPTEEAPHRFAFIGARACDLAAIAIQDRIFLEGPFQDPAYLKRRENAFILAVNCTDPASTCFCTSMHTGPACTTGFDLSLTELENSFLVDIGSPLGGQILSDTSFRLANALEVNRAENKMAQAVAKIQRTLDTTDLPGLLLENLDHPRWDEVALRCLSCTNCTMVCPTCFCSDVVDQSDLIGSTTSRVRVWDSCFNTDFSYVHGGNLRPNTRSRYRQWLTHKLGSWVEQFGTLGCVGCGRCITWCPVGIDLTEEIPALREGELN